MRVWISDAAVGIRLLDAQVGIIVGEAEILGDTVEGIMLSLVS